ncbi:starch phosphorylase [Bradyrhizobium barranii subsp. barranii]|uniref:glycogen/starch/alpha-glucan phosphorylase n=1 Tax=Bradyrhizobium TaxID=374 RepID=UPI00040EE460|nr:MULTISPECIES: glycogen/starch/alpha-glucan phosphorylase [Bradyrhizobium]MBR0876666.1 glycogen/starch/alpha-glucan phosphorylase [Bradyrhizobium liaoningense]MBR0996336.1 glycogen/starch/alpha-glucan phosphorylase [Bradyrhizobium liaoningense]MCP1747707.1 starch phosphorylase [Bradyrhizobium japonicum]MCP1865016.1 starch phosphorylase [Bradyrhizobium japonicum]MCP1896210.1 starch phosphorylase [Bradyrhizobium japonicum]
MQDQSFQPSLPVSGQPIDELALADVKGAILAKLRLAIGKDAGMATKHDWYQAAALALRDRIVHRWLTAEKHSYDAGRKRVYYLSLEFLIGRLFTDALNNMGLLKIFEVALGDLGVSLPELRKCEPDAALGNGGLGRLAACFMESMATLSIPAIGYGIRYDYGLFRQIINQGWQQEYPDEWLSFGNPWELQRPEVIYHVHFGGGVEHVDDKGRDRAIWHPAETVQAIAYDTPIVGWRGQHVNALRLWSARSPDPLKLDAFNKGDYVSASAEQSRAEAICKFLYPNDESPAGRELRLRQEYFFVSASLQDLVNRHLTSDGQLRSLAMKGAVQLNDTHPSLAVTELMRILVDLHNFRWDEAWKITVATLSYTNHTLLPEALETWPVELFERLLPRHLEIIYRINVQHLALAEARAPGDIDFRASVSLIDERSGRRVRMGQLAFVGSHRINGVSAMHSDLMRETVFHDLNHLYPGRITNKTNGITFRRWLMLANPKLTDLLRETCGEAVLDDPTQLSLIEARASDVEFQKKFRSVKLHNKTALARLIGERLGIKVDPTALFDVQIKRIHEYKRQLLNVIETVALYQSIKDDPNGNCVPRVKIFAGKAAASYRYAKLIIKLINDVAEVVNNDPAIGGKLKVVFLPDYNVSLAEVIIPAADLSEQISTAGMEASGTGNMKLSLNGALTIGTLDGANIEIRDHVGAENIAIFGMEAGDVMIRRKQGLDASDVIRNSPKLQRAINAIGTGEFSPGDPGRFESIAHALRYLDHYMVSADFDSYYEAQRSVDARWQVAPAWTRASILNVARMAWFSSDRTIREYAEEIWNVPVNPTTPLLPDLRDVAG